MTMASLFVLDVPEFQPLIEAAGKAGTSVTRKASFARLSAPGRLIIERQATGLGLAIWYGALTGGYQGRVERFDGDQIIIADE
jgi:hypothetical protein